MIDFDLYLYWINPFLLQVHKENIDKVPNAIKGRDNIEIEIYGMEGIPEEDLRAHEKRLAGKDRDEPDNTESVKVPPVTGMPPMPPPLGMMATPPMMPMPFAGMPYGMAPMPLPMMPVPMVGSMRPPMSAVPTTHGNHNSMLPSNPMMGAAPTPTKPLFPSGTTDVSFVYQKHKYPHSLM